MLAPGGQYYNYSGCGNTFNCNHPVVRQFIVDCLRYWVQEMHVDGFRWGWARPGRKAAAAHAGLLAVAACRERQAERVPRMPPPPSPPLPPGLTWAPS
jgi:hypothetical protein